MVEYSTVIGELVELLRGCRIKVTQTNSPQETIRFERRVEGIYESDWDGFVEVRLNKDVPLEYGLLKRRIIHFCPSAKTWQGILKDRKHPNHVFMVEVVGVRYPVYREPLEKFGIAVTGHDVRVIIFERLFQIYKKPPIIYGKNKKPVPEILGAELKECARRFLNDARFSVSAQERYVIEKYLAQV